MQGRNGLDCSPFQGCLEQLMGLLPHLVSAAKSYELTEPLELHAGLGNGYSALGSLWPNDPRDLVGLEFTYGGVFSTSVHREIAENFMVVGNTFRPVLLTIEAQVGLRGLPTAVLGSDNTHEGEVIVAAQTRFRIIGGSRAGHGRDEFVHLRLTGL
jgi:hypothetical protein